jgi:hypothetical protein
MTGCPLDRSGSTPPPQEVPDGECGAGVGCGALGMANVYFVLFGLSCLRRGNRRKR